MFDLVFSGAATLHKDVAIFVIDRAGSFAFGSDVKHQNIEDQILGSRKR